MDFVTHLNTGDSSVFDVVVLTQMSALNVVLIGIDPQENQSIN